MGEIDHLSTKTHPPGPQYCEPGEACDGFIIEVH